MRRMLVTALVAMVGNALPVAAQQAEHHPLVTPYPGSTVTWKDARDYQEYALVTGLDPDKNELRSTTVKGKISRHVYQNPAGRSPLEIYRNYEQALTRAGLSVIWSCAERACGPSYSTALWTRFNGNQAYVAGVSRYLAGTLRTDAGTAYVGLTVGRDKTQIDIVETKEMEAGLVTVTAEAITGGLEKDGHIRIYGIHFDTGKADIRPESKPALDEIVKALRQAAGLKVYVVGHTDNQGTLAYNMKLSRDRADAVVKVLVAAGIAPARLEPGGVGPMAPVATNGGEAGRAKNRRVELVQQ